MGNTNGKGDNGCVDDDPFSGGGGGGGGGFPMNNDDRPIRVAGSSDSMEANSPPASLEPSRSPLVGLLLLLDYQGEQEEEELDNQVSEVEYDLMAKLPTEITIEILSRLPVRDLFSCRWLSKGWYNAINSPSLITMHHNKLMKNNSPSVFLHVVPHNSARRGSYYLIDHESLVSNVTLAAETWISPRLPLPLIRIKNIYSSNGLILVEAYSESTTGSINPRHICFYVCNPITGEHNQIPQPYWPDALTHFIFDSAMGVFKIIRLNFNVMQVYSSRGGEWRTIKKATFAPLNDVLQDVFVNGALHWLGSSSKASPRITDALLSLRFDTEEFKLIPLPRGLDLSKEKCSYLLVLGDCLSLITTVGNKQAIWVMKKYGLRSYWDKKYIIEDMTIYRPITLMPNGEILTVSCRGKFGFYNHETNAFRSIKIGVAHIRGVSVTVSSLISPSAGSIVNL